MGPMTANVAGTYLVRGLVSPRTWLAFTHQVAGLVLGLAAFMVTAVLLFFGVVTLPLALVGLPVLGILLRCADGLAAIERARFGLLLDRTIAGWPADPRRGYRWLLIPRRVTLFGRLTWREIGYAVLRLPVSLVMAALTITAWAVGLVMITLPLYAGQLPGGAPSIDGTSLQGTVVLIVSFVAGLLVLVAAPPLTRGLGLADTAFARWLLAPPENLAARVAELKVSRERVVDAAEAERRRIERDLHDGAQQRLVALAMDLGRAKAKFADDVDAAAELVDQAHVQAKAALTELRNLVRGVHPPVLTDRGLDAALSGLVAISPIPVDVQADVAVRPKPVFVESHGFPGALTVVVSDDGIGGADPLGAGLSGLADRVAGVDGTLSVESPPGGPTIVSAMLPCG
jgi:signal transduction histidine kinase